MQKKNIIVLINIVIMITKLANIKLFIRNIIFFIPEYFIYLYKKYPIILINI
jgi:hypothetical protein